MGLASPDEEDLVDEYWKTPADWRKDLTGLQHVSRRARTDGAIRAALNLDSAQHQEAMELDKHSLRVECVAPGRLAELAEWQRDDDDASAERVTCEPVPQRKRRGSMSCWRQMRQGLPPNLAPLRPVVREDRERDLASPSRKVARAETQPVPKRHGYREKKRMAELRMSWLPQRRG